MLNSSPQIRLHTTAAGMTLMARAGTLVPGDRMPPTAAGSQHAGKATAKERAQPLLLLPTDVLAMMQVRTLLPAVEDEQPPTTSNRNSDIFSSCCFLFLHKTKKSRLKEVVVLFRDFLWVFFGI